MATNIDWNLVSNMEAKSCFEENLGHVQRVLKDYVIIQRGTFNKEKFYIPKDKIATFDGKILKLRISEKEIIERYKKDEHDTTIEDQHDSTINIDRAGGSSGGLLIEEKNDKFNNQAQKKSIEIPIKKEMVFIERSKDSKNTKHDKNIGHPVDSPTNISIPIKREEIVITKKPYIKEVEPDKTSANTIKQIKNKN